MDAKYGRAIYRRGKLHFDEVGWAIVKAEAKKLHKSPKSVVTAALLRSIKQGYFDEKSKKS